MASHAKPPGASIGDSQVALHRRFLGPRNAASDVSGKRRADRDERADQDEQDREQRQPEPHAGDAFRELLTKLAAGQVLLALELVARQGALDLAKVSGDDPSELRASAHGDASISRARALLPEIRFAQGEPSDFARTDGGGATRR